MKKRLTPKGYISLSVPVHGTREEHRAVWIEANGEIPKGMHIHHINGIKSDNRIENLAMVSAKQNNQKYDKAGKGWSLDKNNNKHPYTARRRMFDGTDKRIGCFGTICGAIMASRMAYVNT